MRGWESSLLYRVMKRRGSLVLVSVLLAGGWNAAGNIAWAQCTAPNLTVAPAVCAAGHDCDVPISLSTNGEDFVGVSATLTSTGGLTCGDTCLPGASTMGGGCFINSATCGWNVSDFTLTPFADGEVAVITIQCEEAGTFDLSLTGATLGQPNGFGQESCGISAQLECNDCLVDEHCVSDNPCAVGICDPDAGCLTVAKAPESGCLTAERSQIKLTYREQDQDHRLQWKWSKGEAVSSADLGDPTASTEYALCVYDYLGDVPSLVTSIVLPSGPPWEAGRAPSYRYRDKTTAADGVQKAKLKGGDAGKTNAQLTARGLNLTLPPPATPTEYMHADQRVVVELLNSDGQCFTSEFLAGDILRNREDRFQSTAR